MPPPYDGLAVCNASLPVHLYSYRTPRILLVRQPDELFAFQKTQACLRCRPRLPSPIWEEASCSMWTPSAEAFCSYRAREKSFRCRRYEQISRVGYLSGAAGNAFCASSQAQFAHIAHARRAFAALDMSKSRGRAISAALQASRSLIPPKRNLLISRTREGLSLHAT